MAFAPLRLSAVASDIQTAVVFVAPEEVIQEPCTLGSLGEVEETKTANRVVGFNDGLLFSAFVKLRVEVVGLDKVGAPGVLAEVYVEEAVEVAV